ncbi:cobaltochelatase subunit CobN [Sphingomonas koreensis]|jgi:cobaltochelatase CobN|uniref:Cobalamin biosynthesis protein CobN n=1 Tax=Sphingomonas koreensis TaxID=93064 RepID=A0A1L6J9D2_9SPHN|nr:cobaltochelatase subunit CobN [Sphingomonas koreensis]APR52543.1 cobalamin biosynthesis protein CobN [Sphingomonas koreensis]MDC7811724.1 cobaltochelatase subunit CobN [Sphingomonas koreensis]RSU18031.1 cobaltochelatase subunit CobN [Sphingomonas koreensis]RSU22198.1 cobaltochelatase subunit CobN [Sphingomonas koreensis]RSU23850.1 cobaltochelatase subunit CobN [Sphingomonas koreensis]
MRRLLALILIILIGTAASFAQEAAVPRKAPVVRIVATRFTLPAKFDRLAEWAKEAGYRIEWRQVEDGGTPDELTNGADLLVFDGPRPGDMAAVDKAIGGLGDRLTVPWIAIGGGPPRSGKLAPDAARRLIGYYGGGGAANLHNFVKAVPLALSGGDLSALPPPARLAGIGFYHPAASAPFAGADAFRRWTQTRGWANRQIVAIAIPDGTIRDMQTQVIDAIATALGERGLLAAPFWYDDADPHGIEKTVGTLNPIALVNMTHMQNGAARAAEFAKLDVPVLPALAARSQTVAEWRAAPSGIPASTAATLLAIPESWGVSDPLVVSAVEKGTAVPIPEQIALLAAKLQRLGALRTIAPRDKHVALFFWNHPVGEKNLAASNLNLPRSLANVSAAMAKAGYDVTPAREARLIADGQAMLAGYYRPETLGSLRQRGLAATLPLTAYKAWLGTLPHQQREEILARWGQPEQSRWVRGGAFVIPRLMLGKLAILPQPPRGGDAAKNYHDQKLPPDHIYLAAYLWVRGQADAIVHFGTHGTQEWTPGKDRGLWAGDYPFLLVGDLPVFYPYIQDNVAEAIQARRRGRAVTISHQTPAFGPSGLYDELRDIHALVHQYAQLDDGGVKDRVAGEIRAKASAAHLDRDIGWDAAAIDRDFSGYYAALHDHLHQVARTTVPLGLHSFGEPASAEHRLTTVMQQLGPDYLKTLGEDPVEAFAEDFSAIEQGLPYRTLARYLRYGESPAGIADEKLRAQIERAAVLDARLADTGEIEALLAGLAGRFVLPGAGGDPVRNPDIESGRNLYAFEADKVPTKAAYAQGGAMLDKLVAAYRIKHDGKVPEKLAFVMFSGETIRQQGVVEGQILHALGLRPVWGRGDRLERLDVVPSAELGRPRIDAVVQASSVYRDQFDGFMRMLAGGIDRVAALDDASGPAANARALAAKLIAKGMPADRAKALAALRIFSNAPGDYGTGLPGQIAKDKGWKAEKQLADPFLERLQYAYGASEWGLAAEEANLFAEQLHGVDAAVMSRSSNVHGLLSTDHPFEHLGGLSLAIRSLTGKAPDLYVADLRGAEGQVTTAGAFLSNELRARYLNPQWIGAMQAEGYSGANEMLDIVNNLWGWQVTDPGSVRADQWQAMHDTYVRDTRQLGLDRFFARVHPSAQLQIVDRMIEAVSRGYWQPDAETQRSLEEKRASLAAAMRSDASAAMQSGFGLQLNGPAQSAPPTASQAAPSPSAVRPPVPAAPRGMVLERMRPTPPPAIRPAPVAGLLLGLLLLFIIGVVREMRTRHHPVPA